MFDTVSAADTALYCFLLRGSIFFIAVLLLSSGSHFSQRRAISHLVRRLEGSRASLGLPPCGSASWASPTLSCAAAAWLWGDGLSNRQRAIDTAPNTRQGLRLELRSVIVSTGTVAFRLSLLGASPHIWKLWLAGQKPLTEIIGPQDDRGHPSPKTQVQKPDRKQPRRAPHSESERMLLDLYFDFLAP
jgi:hypothetical protein